MNIFRKIKLEKLGYYKLNDYEKELFKFIKDNFFNLKKVEYTNYTNSVFWFKENKLIFVIDDNWYGINSILFVDIQLKFGFDKAENIIKSVLKEKYKLNQFDIGTLNDMWVNIREIEYKNLYINYENIKI